MNYINYDEKYRIPQSHSYTKDSRNNKQIGASEPIIEFRENRDAPRFLEFRLTARRCSAPRRLQKLNIRLTAASDDISRNATAARQLCRRHSAGHLFRQLMWRTTHRFAAERRS